MFTVCKHSKDFLSSAESMPLLNINTLNPKLYVHVPALDKTKVHRPYLSTGIDGTYCVNLIMQELHIRLLL